LGQVGRKAKDDAVVRSKFDVFRDWTWAGSPEELQTSENALLGEMARVKTALKTAHHEVRV
jgi:hypothetical protein